MVYNIEGKWHINKCIKRLNKNVKRNFEKGVDLCQKSCIIVKVATS